MPYQLIALDVDGTLLRDDHSLSEANISTIREAANRGAEIVLCTGRGTDSALPVLEELGLEGTLITHNGAVIVDSRNRELLAEEGFEPAVIEPLIRHARTNGIHFDVCTAFELWVEALNDEVSAMYEKYLVNPRQVADVLAADDRLVKLTVFGTIAQMDQVEKDWQALLPDAISLIRSGDFFVDVMRRGVSKGAALRKLSAVKGISLERVMAIGNYYNDVAMLEEAGLGIAVANSPDGVKAAADQVTASNNDDGVHWAIQQYILQKA
ncbi:HAD family phosphatase [Xylanibacillus composti]|nr:HAD family phosphatase [Xylanibacillus composti]